MIIKLTIYVYGKSLVLQFDKLFMLFPSDQFFEGEY